MQSDPGGNHLSVYTPGRGGTLTDRLVPAGGLLRDLAFSGGGALFIALSAQISIPLWFTPVPITGQTLAVLLVGATGGTRRGGAALLLYLGGGALGLGFFSPSGGPATYGYLGGFLAAALLVGYLAERGWDRSYRRSIAAMLAGNIVIYLVGLPWLGINVGLHVGATLGAGLTPFIPGDIVKLLLAAAVLPSAWRLLGPRR